jgi:carbonic anhydrase
VSLAGASKGLVENDLSAGPLIMKQIDISKRLHKISEVILLHHMDCGAYGGHAAFSGVKEEREKQIADMREAASRIVREYSDLKIRLALADISEDNKVIIQFIS